MHLEPIRPPYLGAAVPPHLALRDEARHRRLRELALLVVDGVLAIGILLIALSAILFGIVAIAVASLASGSWCGVCGT